MKGSGWIGLGVLAVALVVGAVVSQPFSAARALKSAVVNKDRDALRELVDFPLLRENLKDELPSYLRARSTQDKETTELMAQFASSFSKEAMEEAITPPGLIDLVEKANTTKKELTLSSGYSTPSRFLVSFYAEGGDELIFVLRRQGMKWRVTDIKGALHVLFPVAESHAGEHVEASNVDEAAEPDVVDGAEAEIDSMETPILDAQLQVAQEEVALAAQAAQAFRDKEEADRLAGKSFNESRISWSFACDKSVHGIALLGQEKLSSLSYDEKTSVCSCVKEEVPYNVEMLLASSSRSLSELGEEAYNDQVNAFGACYFRISNIKAQQEQMAAIRRERELEAIKQQQDANLDNDSESP